MLQETLFTETAPLTPLEGGKGRASSGRGLGTYLRIKRTHDFRCHRERI